MVAFPLAGRLFVAGLISGVARELVVDGPVFDPRPDPVAHRLAYVCGNALRIAELDGSSWELASDEDPDVSWGSADFIAAEEMPSQPRLLVESRRRGLAACRVDVAAVEQWYIADPADPGDPRGRGPLSGRRHRPTRRRPPCARASTAAASRSPGISDRFPYLVAVTGDERPAAAHRPIPRPATMLDVLEANPTTGDTATSAPTADELLGRARAGRPRPSSTTGGWSWPPIATERGACSSTARP